MPPLLPTPTDIRPPAVRTPEGASVDAGSLRRITETLNAIEARSATLVVQVPMTESGGERVLKGQLFVNINDRWSFATWVDHNLSVDSSLGVGVAARLKF